MKHRIKNIANRPIPVDGTNLKPKPEQIVKAEMTPKLEYMIKNKFFEDLGEVEVKKEEVKKEEKEEKTEEERPKIKFNKFKKKKYKKEVMI